MFEEVFVSDSWILNSIVFIYIYWWLIVGIFVPAFYYVFIKIFTFPLITRKSHEFVLIISAEGVKIKKISARLVPFFEFKKNLYWFDEPCEDADSMNRFNLYLEGINQPITNQRRRPNKVHDLTHELVSAKQISNHSILLPKKIKDHLKRHWQLVINEKEKLVKVVPVKDRQPLRVSFYHTLGVFFLKERKEQVEMESPTETTSKYQLVQLTTQVILEQIKFTSAIRYYSSHWAFQLSKRIQRVEKTWMNWLTGAIDPKLIIALMVLLAIGALIFLFPQISNPQAALGPMPEG